MSRAGHRWLLSLRMPPRHPLIAIVGATGTGKSQLAVSLAQRFNGEIINGDALQMYEGLPIITNKISLKERKDIPHHLLGCIKLEEQPWTVKKFIECASKIVAEIWSRNKVPILVGGTHYYTQSLLFRNAVVEEGISRCMTGKNPVQKWPILDASTGDMLKELHRVDPTMAMRWHPNDRRKIRRSLEVYLTTGKKASDIYQQQRHRQAEDENHGSNDDFDETENPFPEKSEPSLRHDTLIFWTYAAPDILNRRLEKRVDSMVSEGLLKEVASMHAFLREQEQQGNSPDQTRGIWIAIGLKEFLAYVTGEMCPENLKQESIERTKIATRQYAKYQNRWIRLKLQRALKAAGASHKLFLLDGSDLPQWSRVVEAKASEVTAEFLRGSPLPEPSSFSIAARDNLVATEESVQSTRYCEICEKTLMSEKQWFNHINSKGHKSAAKPKADWEKLYPKDNRA